MSSDVGLVPDPMNVNLKIRVESGRNTSSTVLVTVGRLESKYRHHVAAVDVVGQHRFNELVGHMHLS